MSCSVNMQSIDPPYNLYMAFRITRTLFRLCKGNERGKHMLHEAMRPDYRSILQGLMRLELPWPYERWRDEVQLWIPQILAWAEKDGLVV